MNLIPLCTPCHYSYHIGNFTVKHNYETAMREIYGLDWEEQLIELEHSNPPKRGRDLIDYLHTKIDYYKQADGF